MKCFFVDLRNCEPVSNVNASSDEKPQDHSSRRISTDAEIHKDRRDEHPAKDLDPMIFKQDIPATVIFERKLQPRD
jgi:hypothetical protein